MVIPSRKTSFKDESILVLVLYVFLLAIGIFLCLNIVQTHEEKTDIKLLQNTTKVIGNNFSALIDRDRRHLSSLANILSHYDAYSSVQVLNVLSSPSDSNLISEICILLPNDVVVRQDGQLVNVRGILSYEEESAQGWHITPRTISFFQDYDAVVRHYVPIIKDGKTVAMLYAVINLDHLNSTLADKLLLDDKSQLYVFDGKSGDMLLDTGHQNLQNISILNSLSPDKGESLDVFFNNIKEGKSGNYVFISKRANERFFFHYRPLGVNQWFIAMSRPESEVFVDAIYIRKVLLFFVIFVSVITSAYLFFSYRQWKKNLKLIVEISSIDPTTKLYNRNRLVKDSRFMEANATCPPLVVYVDVNGLHEVNNTQGHKAGDKMLRCVAIALEHNFRKDRIYRIGGDEFFVICRDVYEDSLASKIKKTREELRVHNYEVAVGFAYREDLSNLGEMMSAADASMLEDKRLFYKIKNNDRRMSRNT